MAITLDFESNNPSSNLGRTFNFYWALKFRICSFSAKEMTQRHPLVVLNPTQLLNDAVDASKNGETGSFFNVEQIVFDEIQF